MIQVDRLGIITGLAWNNRGSAQSRHRSVITSPTRNMGMPRKNRGPAQSAIPTTMRLNPTKIAVNLPTQAIVQKTSRNGKVTTYQSVPRRFRHNSIQAHEPGCPTTWFPWVNGPSAR